MRSVLEEVHRATMQNPRAAALFSVLVQPGELLCMFIWDSWPVKIQKPGNHKDQRSTWSSKITGNCLSRMEACDLEGKPVFKLCTSASTSPRATDEAISFFTLEMEAVTGLRGGLTTMLVGQPGFTMVHLFDNGYR